MKKNIFYSILFLFFIFIFSIFFISLDKPNLYAPTQVKNKILAEFSSNELFLNKKFKSNDIIQENKFTIVNIWSSWCVPCRQEHSLLMDLAKKNNIISLYPEIRIYNQPNILTSEADIISTIFFDKFIVINLLKGEEIFNVRYQTKPFMIWIWISTCLISIGGILGIFKR